MNKTPVPSGVDGNFGGPCVLSFGLIVFVLKSEFYREFSQLFYGGKAVIKVGSLFDMARLETNPTWDFTHAT